MKRKNDNTAHKEIYDKVPQYKPWSSRSLELAVKARDLEVVKHFLSEGSNPNQTNIYGQTPFNIASHGAMYGLCASTNLYPPKLEKLDEGFVQILIELLKAIPIDLNILLPKENGRMVGSEKDLLKFFNENLDEICTLKPFGLEKALSNLSKSLEGLPKLQLEIEAMSKSLDQYKQIRSQLIKIKLDKATPMLQCLEKKLQEIESTSQFTNQMDPLCSALIELKTSETESREEGLGYMDDSGEDKDTMYIDQMGKTHDNISEQG